MPLSPDARLVPRPDVAAREIEDGAVLVHMGSGACFELNRIGFEIWKALGAGTTVGGGRIPTCRPGSHPNLASTH